MEYAERVVHHSHTETLEPGSKVIDILCGEDGDKWLVVSLNLDMLSNDVVSEPFACPSYPKSFLLDLRISLFRLSQSSGCIRNWPPVVIHFDFEAGSQSI